jgi:hypothetical protein
MSCFPSFETLLLYYASSSYLSLQDTSYYDLENKFTLPTPSNGNGSGGLIHEMTLSSGSSGKKKSESPFYVL